MIWRSIGTARSIVEENLSKAVGRFTEQAFADLVFEVSGTRQVGGHDETAARKCRIVMVAITRPAAAVSCPLFCGTGMIGVRVYEPQTLKPRLPGRREEAFRLDRLEKKIAPLADLQQVFDESIATGRNEYLLSVAN